MMSKGTALLIVLFAGIVFFAMFAVGPGKMASRGFYTADFLEYGNTQDWYVASNTGLHAGTA